MNTHPTSPDQIKGSQRLVTALVHGLATVMLTYVMGQHPLQIDQLNLAWLGPLAGLLAWFFAYSSHRLVLSFGLAACALLLIGSLWIDLSSRPMLSLVFGFCFLLTADRIASWRSTKRTFNKEHDWSITDFGLCAIAILVTAYLFPNDLDTTQRTILLIPAGLLLIRAWASIKARLIDTNPKVLLLTLLSTVIAAGLNFVFNHHIPSTLSILCLPPLFYALRPAFRLLQTQVDAWLSQPPLLLAGSFAFICLLGGVALALPFAATNERNLSFIDTLFTATSAVCVTGLITLDTPKDFSLIGQGIILVLIQIGGLGIMSFSAGALALLGRRLSMRHEHALSALTSEDDHRLVLGSVKSTLQITFIIEGVGAVLLTLLFANHGDPWLTALWRGIFTAISAFCNAGFALQSDNLIGYQHSPFVLHTVAALIVLGGLSPPVIASMRTWRLKTFRHLDLQIRMITTSTVALLILGTMMVLSFEWSRSLNSLGLFDKLHNAWFQSVTLRTAGFNSIDFAMLSPATATAMMVFMFIGGAPGGTAGGIKVTTATALLAALVAAVRGHKDATWLGRRLSERTVFKAAAIATSAFMLVLSGILILQLTQEIPYVSACFEVVSALGTVGLSLGATNQLDWFGKALIIVCMFLGRIGPLALSIVLAKRKARAQWVLPETRVDLG